MNKKLQQMMESLVPFVILGIGIALAIGLLIMFSYVLVWGVLIGGVIWIIYFIKSYFFNHSKPQEGKGRIIEHDDDRD